MGVSYESQVLMVTNRTINSNQIQFDVTCTEYNGRPYREMLTYEPFPNNAELKSKNICKNTQKTDLC
jgi:hypothetical protein